MYRHAWGHITLEVLPVFASIHGNIHALVVAHVKQSGILWVFVNDVDGFVGQALGDPLPGQAKIVRFEYVRFKIIHPKAGFGHIGRARTMRGSEYPAHP